MNNKDVEEKSERVALTGNGSLKRKKQGPMPRWFTVCYYILLSAIALGLTIASKGTKLYDNKGLMDKTELVLLLCHYFAVLIAFGIVHNSDPGYITFDYMQSVCEEDGLSIVGRCIDIDVEVQGENHLRTTTHRNDTSSNDSSTMSLSTTDIEMTTLNQPLSLEGNDSDIGVSRRNKTNNLEANSEDGDAKANNNSLQKELKSGSSVTSEETYWKTTRRKFCSKCQIAPPLRSHHCKICQKCVATFDHHCGFIGACIGERNHCRFYWFLLIQFLGFWKCCSVVRSSSLGITCRLSTACMKTMGDGSGISNVDIAVIVIARFYLYLLTFSALLMVIAHTVLVLSNGTTFEIEKKDHLEYLRGVEMCDLPFSKGLFSNLKLFCCMRDVVTTSTSSACISNSKKEPWKPIVWKPVGPIVRDSEDWIRHPWQNKYWTCC